MRSKVVLPHPDGPSREEDEFAPRDGKLGLYVGQSSLLLRRCRKLDARAATGAAPVATKFGGARRSPPREIRSPSPDPSAGPRRFYFPPRSANP